MGVGSGESPIRNCDLRWDDFDSASYFEHNYAVLRDDDQEILECVRDFFTTFAATMSVDGPVRGVDVGTGSNLYPALAMLPWCDEITMIEHSASNVAWLENEVRSYGASWDQFWKVLLQDRVYHLVEDPRRALAERAVIQRGSVFDLPTRRWEIDTMFFVACSISEEIAEFKRASECFVNALVPGAPFAMAFMEKSHGYDVGSIRYPAVSLELSDIQDRLAGMGTDLQVNRIVGTEMLREGYDAMVLVRGRTRREPAGRPPARGV